MTEMDDFSSHVQGLPPELFNEIYSLVFTPPPSGSAIRIHSNYKVPFQLQVSKRHSSEFATTYYGTNVFYFNSYNLMCKRLPTLSKSPHMPLKQIVYTGKDVHTGRYRNSNIPQDLVKDINSCEALRIVGVGRELWVKCESAGCLVQYCRYPFEALARLRHDASTK